MSGLCMELMRVRRLAVVAAVFVVSLGSFQFGMVSADTVEARAPISREAYFTYPVGQTAPPLLRAGFPPATACLVAGLVGVPQICGTEAQQVASLLGLTDGLPIPITPESDLAQPNVLPGTTPVGMAGGQPRYVSLAALNLPPLSAGQRFGKFELVLSEDGINYSIESPALRDVVLQAVRQLQDGEPQLVADAITRAITGEVPLAAETITGIEACPIVEAWNAGRGQSASLDGSRLPATDCVAGTTGAFDPATRTWVFDLTFAVQAWTEGTDGEVLANQGVMFRPVGAPNLAYGDPDFSTNWTVSLADSTTTDPKLAPRVRYTTVVDETESVLDPVDEVDLPELVLGASDDALGDLGLGVGPSLAPRVSGKGNADAGSAVGRAPRTIANSASTPLWLWLLLPLLLIGSYMFDQSLNATPAALRRRPGALTHLEKKRDQD
ncbi:MAG TPA: hypothetical protein VMZ22_11515 [Acidimicrobiales bacterium]|nr:hypothetical protein [Acidimicrobiales bacterium]